MYELAYFLGRSVLELRSLPYEELLGWQEYFRRRPYGWREDNRAAVVAMSLGGSKLKATDLFDSLKQLERERQEASEANLGRSMFEFFSQNATNPELAQKMLEGTLTEEERYESEN